MSPYKAPLSDAEFVIRELLKFDQRCEQQGLDEVNSELATVIIEEAGKLASGVLAPLNSTGDESGAKLTDNGVQQTEGFADAYQQFIENGWATLSGPEEFGGQALPNLISTAANELWHSANMAFALCPMLSQGAVEALIAHGSDELKAQYLPPLISGEWTGTMNLTEPNAGSDLAAVATKAVPQDDHYLITGQKIFITWGDHQMTDNIVHLVLARLPDAPAGVKGISLFIVPKFMLDAESNPAELNDVSCVSLEHKLGIHGSPTCVMSFGDNGGAKGYLVGEENKGLLYMFTMMNHARQSVGLQGLSISERAYQQAVEYARDRVQGSRRDGSKIAIVDHPDVRRMLMAMKAGTESMRALAYTAAADVDTAHADSENPAANQRVELLTPIIKGWLTEMAQELTSLNIQVHGGMGYIEETGAAQHFRDARILPIYEGTTGIQALDFIGRKTLLDQGKALTALHADIGETVSKLQSADQPELSRIADQLDNSLKQAVKSTEWLLTESAEHKTVAATICNEFLMLHGYLCGGWMMAASAYEAVQLNGSAQYSESFLSNKLLTAGFYAGYYLPRVQAHAETMQTGLSGICEADQEQLFN